MIRRKEREIKVIYVIVLALFAAFLAIPVVRLLIESFVEEAGVGLSYYTEVLTERGFMKALTNSITVSFVSALISTVLAFILAYSIQRLFFWKGNPYFWNPRLDYRKGTPLPE